MCHTMKNLVNTEEFIVLVSLYQSKFVQSIHNTRVNTCECIFNSQYFKSMIYYTQNKNTKPTLWEKEKKKEKSIVLNNCMWSSWNAMHIYLEFVLFQYLYLYMYIHFYWLLFRRKRKKYVSIRWEANQYMHYTTAQICLHLNWKKQYASSVCVYMYVYLHFSVCFLFDSRHAKSSLHFKLYLRAYKNCKNACYRRNAIRMNYFLISYTHVCMFLCAHVLVCVCLSLFSFPVEW